MLADAVSCFEQLKKLLFVLELTGTAIVESASVSFELFGSLELRLPAVSEEFLIHSSSMA